MKIWVSCEMHRWCFLILIFFCFWFQGFSLNAYNFLENLFRIAKIFLNKEGAYISYWNCHKFKEPSFTFLDVYLIHIIIPWFIFFQWWVFLRSILVIWKFRKSISSYYAKFCLFRLVLTRVFCNYPSSCNFIWSAILCTSSC